MSLIPYPDFLTHYYEASQGPFRSLSDLDPETAEAILQRIREDGVIFASKRNADYLRIRRGLETQIRQLFIQKGGQPRSRRPHYFILGSCDWVKSWYQEGREVIVPIRSFDPAAISFTYGDSFPAMRYKDGKPYRCQVYTLSELGQVIEKYGLPQQWNCDGSLGPERYIEAQVWDDEPIQKYLAKQERL